MSFHILLEDGSGAVLLEDPVSAPTVPVAPTIGVATASVAGATVAFTDNGNGGSPITNHIATSNPGNVTVSGASSPIVYPAGSLSNGVTYTFTVVAVNAVGQSLSSAVSNSVTPAAAATVPAAPTIGTATAGDGQATVSYTLNSNGGSPVTSVTITSNPGGIQGVGLANPQSVTGLTDGVAYTFVAQATNAVGISAASASSNSVTPAVSADLTVYANGNVGPLFQKTPVLSFGCTLDYNYHGTSPPPPPGSSQCIQVATNTAFGGGYQPGSLWTTIPPNGLDDRPYTRLQFSLYTPNPASMYVNSHYSRSTGNDIGGSTAWTQGSTCLNIPANTWTTVTGPLSSVALLGAANEYKFAIGTNAPITFYVDNIKFLAGNVGWAFQGTGTPAAGWTDASVSATADYTFLPNSRNVNLFAINNPANPASQFKASASGTALTVASIQSGSINIGDTVCHDTSTPVGTILSGSFPNYVLSASAGTIAAGTTWASAPAQSKITACRLTAGVANGTLKLTHAGFDTTPYGTFTFGVLPTKTGYGYQVQFLNTSGVAVGNAVNVSAATTQHDFGFGGNPPTFTVHNMALSLFGAIPSTIGGFTIRETSANTTNITDFSAIGFTSP